MTAPGMTASGTTASGTTGAHDGPVLPDRGLSFALLATDGDSSTFWMAAGVSTLRTEPSLLHVCLSCRALSF